MVDQRVRSKRWTPVHQGIYIDNIDDSHALWMARMAAHVHRGGAGSAVSHRAAAVLHGLDGDWAWPNRAEDLLVPSNSTFRTAPAIRTSDLGQADVITIDGLPVTTVARCLEDLGRFVPVDDVEVALESALRIADPRVPHLGSRALLEEVRERQERGPRRIGRNVLREVLARRPDGATPTGSYAETRAAQAFRLYGLELSRQPRIRMTGSRGGIRGEWFPDFADLRRGLVIEIDGAVAHGSPESIDRDSRRQNALSEVFTVLRFSALLVFRDPSAVGRTVAVRYASMKDRGPKWRNQFGEVTVEGDGCTVRSIR